VPQPQAAIGDGERAEIAAHVAAADHQHAGLRLLERTPDARVSVQPGFQGL